MISKIEPKEEPINIVEDKAEALSVHEGRYFLEIDNWASQKRPLGASFYSPLFHMHSTDTWKLQIFQNGKSEKDEGYVTVRIHLMSKPALKAKCVVFILNQKTEDEVRRPAVLLDSECSTWECARLIETEKTFDPNFGICVNDCVTIGVDVIIYGAVGEKVVTDYDIKQTNTIAADLLQLIDDPETSDIVLISDKRDLEVRCHRFMLAARSPVFRGLFKKPWFATKSLLLKHSVSLATTLSAETLREFLHFIYSDEFSSDNVSHETWVGLLRAASEYRVPGLKSISEKVLATHLASHNMNKLLLLGHETGSWYLSEQAAHFIDNHQHLRCNSKTIVSSSMLHTSRSSDVAAAGISSSIGRSSSGDEPPPPPPRLVQMGVPENGHSPQQPPASSSSASAVSSLDRNGSSGSSDTSAVRVIRPVAKANGAESSTTTTAAGTTNSKTNPCVSCFAHMSLSGCGGEPDVVMGSFKMGV